MPMAQINTLNDSIIGQARQGSVAAIIQVLNEQLADAGIRTRAILADGILQLLCEAPTAEQLPQTDTVNRVQSILESLAPRAIRKVNINSRLVQEQQLLWLEDVTRDPQKLLWSELVTLKQPHMFKRLWQDWQQPQPQPQVVVPESKPRQPKQHYFLRGLIGGASLCLLLVLVGWTLKDRLGISWSQAQLQGDVAPEPDSDEARSTDFVPDSFAQAVRLAEEAAVDGQVADSSAEWLDLATRWQRASDLMAQVPPDDERHTTAQDRVLAYQQNREQALRRAMQLQQTEPVVPPEAQGE